MLFKKKPKEPRPTFTATVPYTEHFRGYKRIALANYRDAEAERGTAIVMAAGEIREITFKEYIFPDTNPLMRVYADGNKIGTIWSNSHREEYKKIKSGRCTAASFTYNELGNWFLFLRFK